MRKNIFIGPFSFHICADERFITHVDIQPFEKRMNFEYTDYSVVINSSDQFHCKGNLISKTDYFDIFLEDEIEHRYYFQNYDGSNHYYAHASLSEYEITIEFYEGISTFGRAFDFWRFLFLEKLLIKNHGFILHSSSVLWNGKALLFTAPSGTGKSTQADLWKKYENAEGINGDRNIVMLYKGFWYCCGLPWHGSSGDCKNIVAPLRCISLIRQNPTDSILPLTTINKIKYLYAEISKNSWDLSFVEESLTLIENLVNNVDIMQLNCTMNQTAVDCLKEFIEG